MSETEKQIEELKAKMREASEKVKDASETVLATGMVAKDDLSDKISTAKGDLAEAKRKAEDISSQGKSRLSSELIKAQLTLEETRKKIDEKKEEVDKEYERRKINDKLDYSAACVELAIVAANEAKVAYLEALKEDKEFNEKYGEDRE